MNTFLLTWNPKKWHWEEMNAAIEKTKKGQIHSEKWSCNTKQIHIGDRIFLVRLGAEPKGIIASGYVTSELYESQHWDAEKRANGIQAQRVDIDFDLILDGEREDIIYMDELNKGELKEQHWSSQTSGIAIKEDIAKVLESKWKELQRIRNAGLLTGINFNQKILSLPASGTYDIITDTFIHAHPATPSYSYKDTPLITFRKTGGIMETLYTVSKTIEIVPSRADEIIDLDYNEKGNLKKYIERRAKGFGFTDDIQYKFYFLSPKYVLNEGFILSPNHQSQTYYSLEEVIRGIGVNHISGLDIANEHEISIKDADQITEGAKKQITVNAYERSYLARRRCLEHYGVQCVVCGFNATEIYGREFENKIHVHHIKPLNEIGKEYVVDPVRDLVPVCPNCHMIIHSREPAYLPGEIKERFVGGQRNG
ncbi:MAG TPA: EVE domain-containing protein [Epulopiscium sp.]|nr:EVE domain-containing protein [Candidatus Epulonipiscium sp.]